MTLNNKAYVTNMAKDFRIQIVSRSILLIISFLIYNLAYATSFPHNKPGGENKGNLTGNVFRILQNGEPVIHAMGVAVNSEGVFQIQVKRGVELKKIKEKPISAEISILRGETKISTKTFADINVLGLQNLRPWIESNYQEGDKISIQLFNTVLDAHEATKIYSLGRVY